MDNIAEIQPPHIKHATHTPVSPWGYFDNETKEFVLETPFAPRHWKNILWNKTFNAQPNQASGGISYLREKDGRIILLNWSGEKYIYLQNLKTGQIFNPGFSPICDKSFSAFECRYGLSTSTTRIEQHGLKVEVVQSVDSKKAQEYFELSLNNLRSNSESWRIIFFADLNLSAGDGKFGADDYFAGSTSQGSRRLEITNKSIPDGSHTAFLECDHTFGDSLFDLNDFTGVYGSIARPEALLENWPTETRPIQSPALAGYIDCELAPHTNKSMLFTLGLVSKDQQSSSSLSTKSQVESSRQKQTDWFKNLYEQIEVATPDAEFDLFVNTWIKHQLTYCAYWNRGWGKGFRDSNQDAWAFTLLDPARSRDMILDCLPYQYADGRTVRRWAPIVRDQYNDGGTWLIFATHAYLSETGDTDILNHVSPFFESDESGSVYEHLKRGADYLWDNRGDRGLCLMPFGDWNDRLTGIGKDGKGQSVWTTMALLESLKKLEEIARLTNKSEDVTCFSERHTCLLEVLRKEAWNGKWYSRAFNDAGDPVGSPDCAEGAIYLLPQAWSILCGIATDEQIPQLIKAVHEELETVHGFRLLSPPYSKYDPSIGHLSATPPGQLENGGNYCHGTMFMAYALCMAKHTDYALDIFKKIFPTNPDNPPAVSRQEPFSLTNSYFAPESGELAGRSLFSWRTGTAGWAFRCAIEGIMGVKADINGLEVRGDLPSGWNQASMTRTMRGKKLNIIWQKTGEVSRTLNGVPVGNDALDPDAWPKDTNELNITF
ncbi:GH36-type glycosyl hydrolase domain-containing protein [Rubellicoccus peritrichatus]|uniref:Glycosyl transferase family 36 n=1 Tax=Rubellicoccus peritrichatus TaxID=3080537 RepID=A0AAQ3LBH1_9BACT|nr:hypothetical protein [Puniceicoccus sp. CR14]WOO41469.1 hypothetical protein RZN69_00110 [Puniceicoccus sp. CR14]